MMGVSPRGEVDESGIAVDLRRDVGVGVTGFWLAGALGVRKVLCMRYSRDGVVANEDAAGERDCRLEGPGSTKRCESLYRELDGPLIDECCAEGWLRRGRVKLGVD